MSWFRVVYLLLIAGQLDSIWHPPKPNVAGIIRVLDHMLAYAASYAFIYSIFTGDIVTGIIAGIATIIALIQIWRNGPRGKGRKAARLIGDKSRQILAKMAEVMRGLQPVPAPA